MPLVLIILMAASLPGIITALEKLDDPSINVELVPALKWAGVMVVSAVLFLVGLTLFILHAIP